MLNWILFFVQNRLGRDGTFNTIRKLLANVP